MNPFKKRDGLELVASQKEKNTDPNLEKDPFGGNMENTPKHEARSSSWWETEPDTDAPQTPCLPNGTKGYTGCFTTLGHNCRR